MYKKGIKLKENERLIGKDAKGTIKLEFLTITSCPKCGAGVKRYYASASAYKWKEQIDFTCGYNVRSMTPLIMEDIAMCKESKEFKKLRDKRLRQFEKVEKFVEENIDEDRLFRDFQNKLSTIKNNITNWWGS